MRNFRCVEHRRQKELAYQFPWLAAVQMQEAPPEVGVIALSVFDHWLSETEALELLPPSSTHEQACRDSLHTGFFMYLRQKTEILSFVWRGRRKDHPRFRSFISPASTNYYDSRDYFLPLKFVLPSLSAAYFQGYDDTSYVYFTQPGHAKLISKWANDMGLHVLP